MISVWLRNSVACTLMAVASVAMAAGSSAPAPTNPPVQAATSASDNIALDAHTKEDIARHEGMAKAHAQAAQCLASGTAHDVCQKQLQAACKGLALGKHCGLRHAH